MLYVLSISQNQKNDYLQKTENELKLRNYSPKTIKGYMTCIKDYLAAKNDDLELVNIDFIKNFLLSKKGAGLSSQTINLYLHSIKFFYRDIVKSLIAIDLKFAKTSNKLPIVLSRNEESARLTNNLCTKK